MLTPELDILKPVDPSISNPDDYEIFTLSDARVLYNSNGKPASLLAAYADTPLKVEGRLEQPDRQQAKYLVKKPYKPVEIEICNVTRFSYGQMEDGEIMIWALGAAGWFEIRPARTYKDIYLNMVEAVEVLYFVTDIYNEPRKRGGGPSASLIFQEYAEDERFACDDPTQAEMIFRKHKAFLFMCMLNRAQGIGWSNTPLYQWFRKQYLSDFENAKARIEGKSAVRSETASKPESTPEKPKAKGGKGTKKAQKPEDAPKKDDNWWEATAIFEFMQKAINQHVMHIGHVTIDRLARLMVRRYEISDVGTATNVILVHATNLCYIMDHPRRKNTRFFAEEQIYRELSSDYNLSAADIRRAQSIELRPRKDHGTLKAETSEESESSSSAATPPQRRQRSKKGRLSVLRPKNSIYSGKGKGIKRGKGKAPNAAAASSSDQSTDTFSAESEIEVDTPTHIQSLSPPKRKLDVDDIVEDNPNPRKRAASSSTSIEPSPHPYPSTSSSSPDEEEANEPLPLRWQPSNNPTNNTTKSASPALAPPIVSTPLPTFTPNGPKDSWICTFDGCSQKVYGASSEVGRMLIQEHLQDHARGRAKEIGIVMREEERLRLPVNNLIKKIREMAEAQQPLFPAMNSGPAMRPQPIERPV
ncbi:hypothetical protein CC78DRAFT_503303 [Lojkania enalia]|uniref:DNA (cytosine-5)-methyltransferase 1 replication foci domain-containing protein n=1 Tax=Lojkania enalia TaxID=147567 RepID=A0A9P4JYP6_9PLEO|nr:hypothetical protein CC78DRAFT_503303 [Didymosphaeria enalia]